jgi:hypothetical protein
VEDETVLRWDVGSDQIDFDQWARAMVRAVEAGEGDSGGSITRWGILLAVVVAILIVILTGPSGALVIVLPTTAIVGGLVALRVTGTKRLAERLRSIPSASEPFTFVADHIGTRSIGESGSDHLSWRRYKRAALDGDLIVLTLDNDTVRILPVAALVSSPEPSIAVSTIRNWIDAARRAPAPDTFN